MWKHIVFAFQEWGTPDGIQWWLDKHLGHLVDAVTDLLPLLSRYRKAVAPESTRVAKLEDGLRRVVDNANPQQGDMFSPVNPNPNAG